ncbi:S24 family peptidase [Photobacterium leiognathi]|uniref:S24 family peptidase n=1 Tax=Photobacterium leiognathi TaxID=553611 RepID=UPI002981BD7D|nr:S24 family peptidase [Photobacterium leiognathi]
MSKMPAFAPPTHGYEESPISEQITNLLLAGGTSHAIYAPNDLTTHSVDICKTDVIVIDRNRTPKNQDLIVVELDGEVVLAEILISRSMKVKLRANNRQGIVNDGLNVIGVVTNLIKDQLI